MPPCRLLKLQIITLTGGMDVRATIKKRGIFVGLVCIALIVIALIGWSFDISRENLVQKKVQSALSIGVKHFELVSPRIEVKDNGVTYYVPNANDQSNWLILYHSVLITLNQDSSAPICKVQNVTMDSDLQSVLDAFAIVEYDGLFGIKRKVVISYSTSMPHYRTSQVS